MAKYPLVTEEAFKVFCAHVAQGMPRWEAARRIGTTSTKVRFAIKRNPGWKPLYDEAMADRRRAAEMRRMLGVG